MLAFSHFIGFAIPLPKNALNARVTLSNSEIHSPIFHCYRILSVMLQIGPLNQIDMPLVVLHEHMALNMVVGSLNFYIASKSS